MPYQKRHHVTLVVHWHYCYNTLLQYKHHIYIYIQFLPIVLSKSLANLNDCVVALGKLPVLAHVCLCHQAVQSGTGKRVAMLCSWEVNCISAITLAMCQRLSGITTYELTDKERKMSTLCMLLRMGMACFTFLLSSVTVVSLLVYTVSQKNAHIFIFQITLSTINRF